jgi:histidine ammonia-lyase
VTQGRPWGAPEATTTRASGAHGAALDASRPPHTARVRDELVVVVGTGALGLGNVTDVARHQARVVVTDGVRRNVAAAHAVVLETLRAGSPAYGVNTGLGAARDQLVPEELLLAFQEQVISSHAAAIGAPLDAEEVRALMFARLAGMSRGGSGASPQLFEALRRLLDARIHPVVPSQGSVGAADLVQMAAVGAVLLGRGRVLLGPTGASGTRPAAEALADAGLEPVQLQPKDALALIGANSASVGTGILAVRSIGHLVANADVVAAGTVLALGANTSVFDDELVRARPLPGQIESAARIRAALGRPRPEGVRSVQDPVSLRTVPQVHGVAADQLAHVAQLLLVELNSRPENPLVQVEQRRVVSNGNFSLLGLGLGFEALRLALAHIGMLAERRVALLARTLRGHAPVADHVRAGRWRSGYLVPVLLTNTAAAIVSELKQMASPLTVMGTPVGDGVEDHNSLTFGAIQLTVTAAGWVQTLLAIELLLAGDLALAAPAGSPREAALTSTGASPGEAALTYPGASAGEAARTSAGGALPDDAHPAARLVAEAVAEGTAGRTTDEVVERLRGLLISTCLSRPCLGDVVVGHDEELPMSRRLA